MSYGKIGKFSYSEIKMSIAVVLFMSLVIILSAFGLTSVAGNAKNGSYIYNYLINQTMPVVETVAQDFQEQHQVKFSIRDTFLSALGINIYNPLSVMGKEVSFFKTIPFENSNIEVVQKNFSFNPFNLDESSIFKNKSTNEQQSVSDPLKDVPNNVVSVYDPALKKNNINIEKPEVFIYHTHTTESYQPGDADKEDPTKNICAVGEQLVNELQNNFGISAVQDKTNHSNIYKDAYYRSSDTIDKYLKKYGDFKLIIDLHRDSGEDKKSFTTKMNGENVAKMMFVMARKNPHFDKNEAVVNKLQQISERLYPGFSKGIFYYNYGTKYFNQDKSNNSVLIEVGSDINTLEEAKASSKYIARVIAELINGK